MITNAYSLFDSKASLFTPPFYAHADALAMRMVVDAAADMNTTIGRHPGDFVLFHVGHFNDNTGQLEARPPVNLGLVASMLQGGSGA